MNYDRVTEKFDIPFNNSSFIKFTKLCTAISSCWEENKNYQSLDNHDLFSPFRSAFNNITFFFTRFIFVCVSLVLKSQTNIKNFGVKLLFNMLDWEEIYKTNYLSYY